MDLKLIISVRFFLCFFSLCNLSFLLGDAPLCKMDDLGNVIAIKSVIDGSGYSILESTTLAAGETTWSTPINISYAIGKDIININPSLHSNLNGDIILLWNYVNPDTVNFYLASAIMPSRSSSWNVSTISTSSENANYGDHHLALNDNGNLMVLWTSSILGSPVVRMSTSQVGDSTTWSSPINLDN